MVIYIMYVFIKFGSFAWVKFAYGWVGEHYGVHNFDYMLIGVMRLDGWDIRFGKCNELLLVRL